MPEWDARVTLKQPWEVNCKNLHVQIWHRDSDAARSLLTRSNGTCSCSLRHCIACELVHRPTCREAKINVFRVLVKVGLQCLWFGPTVTYPVLLWHVLTEGFSIFRKLLSQASCFRIPLPSRDWDHISRSRAIWPSESTLSVPRLIPISKNRCHSNNITTI